MRQDAPYRDVRRDQEILLSLLVTGLALLIDRFGEPPARWHPVVWFGAYLGWVKRCKDKLAAPPQLLWTGATTLALGCTVIGFTAWLTQEGVALLPIWLGVPLTALLLKPSLSLRALTRAGDEVRRALEQRNLPEARRALGYHLVSRETHCLSEAEVAGAAVESLAENLTDSVVAPLLYFTLFGLAGAWVYRFVNTADAVLGYRRAGLEHLGKAAARTDDVLNFVPARLSALMLVVTAPLVRVRARDAWRAARRDAGRTPSPNAGWTMAAAAGGLGVTLDKRETYTLNAEGRGACAADIHTVIRWLQMSSLFTVLLLGAAHGFWRG